MPYPPRPRVVFPNSRGTPSATGPNKSWIPTTAFLLGLASTFLWFRGWLYRSAFFAEAGLDVAQFPMGLQETVSFGALPWLLPVFQATLLFAAIAYAFLFVDAMWANGVSRAWRYLKAHIGWRLSASVSFATVLSLAISATLILGFLAIANASNSGKTHVRETVKNYLTAQCKSTAIDGVRVPFVRIERAALHVDGREHLRVEEGAQLACTERFCALVQVRHDKTWFAKIVPLDKIVSFEAFTKVEARVDC